MCPSLGNGSCPVAGAQWCHALEGWHVLPRQAKCSFVSLCLTARVTHMLDSVHSHARLCTRAWFVLVLTVIFNVI